MAKKATGFIFIGAAKDGVSFSYSTTLVFDDIAFEYLMQKAKESAKYANDPDLERRNMENAKFIRAFLGTFQG